MLLLKEELLVAGAFEENWAIRMPPSQESGDSARRTLPLLNGRRKRAW